MKVPTLKEFFKIFANTFSETFHFCFVLLDHIFQHFNSSNAYSQNLLVLNAIKLVETQTVLLHGLLQSKLQIYRKVSESFDVIALIILILH